MSREDLYKSYKNMCIKKGYSYETFKEWEVKNYPARSSVVNSKVNIALRQQEHFGRELHYGKK